MVATRLRFRICGVALLIFALSGMGSAYSVLTHEEVVDLLWGGSIRPLLLERFPGSSEQALVEAHSYAYGGAVIQDLGYYPFGNEFFSDLLHYVRTGDFVENLLAEASDLNEYAFALGALAHYASDITGHPYVNRAVPIEYPKLRKHYGPVVTYAEGKLEHLRTEFGFDVAQIARNRYAPQSYHDFIGFRVAKPALERAFFDTYRMPLDTVLPHEDLAIGTYRRAISKVIPGMTRVALASRKKEIAKEYPNFSKRKFLYNLSRADYHKEWGRDYQQPGAGARTLALLLRVVPKIGPFHGLAYRDPTPRTEDLYFKSVNLTVDSYRKMLNDVRERKESFSDMDLDTGDSTAPGEYSLADQTYAKLMQTLGKDDFAAVDEPLKQNLLAFFLNPKSRGSSTLSADEDRPFAIAQLQMTEPAPSSLYVAKERPGPGEQPAQDNDKKTGTAQGTVKVVSTPDPHAASGKRD